DATPDATFGTNGVVTSTEVSDFGVHVDGAVVDSLGRTVVEVARSPDGGGYGRQVFVARYLADGRVDTSFGDHGRVTGCQGPIAAFPDGSLVCGYQHLDPAGQPTFAYQRAGRSSPFDDDQATPVAVVALADGRAEFVGSEPDGHAGNHLAVDRSSA